ncbi:MAG: transporter substrate-binding domain-containing protein [Deltaproteobacteria bacterium]|nr:transporter substrate-binding domain-containing protein [Deltaproteobacteria bacterium]MBW2595683.1 transporter substrate-binding domain-containing protein [Deltaproteobacteria bacterium]
MTRNIFLVILSACIFITIIAGNVSAEKQGFEEISQVYTLEYPPVCFTKDGKATGIATEMVREALKRLDVSYDIRSLPWKRAYAYLSEEPDVMLFTVTRTEARENLFKWAGPIITSRLVFFARKDSTIEIKSLEDAKKVDRIGLVQGYSVEKHLRERGFTNIDTMGASEKTNPVKLMKGRIDLWATVDLVGIYNAKLQGINPEDMKIVYVVIKDQHKYIAFSKQVPDEIVQKWQDVLDEMKQDGTFKKVLDKWVK